MRKDNVKKIAAFSMLLLITACAAPTPEREERTLTPVSFSDLNGWESDPVAEVIPAFRRQCDGHTTRKNPPACAALADHPPETDSEARVFFETWFRPYAVAGQKGPMGLFTGYYEADLRGDVTRHDQFQTPLYAHPDDLVTVDLAAFKPEWKGQSLVGKVEKGHVTPYDDYAMIARRGLEGRAKPLVWVDDPVDAFFLAIQGSGRVKLGDGRVVQIGYDGANGRPYVPIGKILAESGALSRPVTMPKIRAWLYGHPNDAQAMMIKNPSYVFYRFLEGDGPIGAAGVPLTPRRSLAVDPAFIPLGAPVWLDTHNGEGDSFRHLMMAQDTGGAMKGVVRGDVFWGYGREAERQAGAMQSEGTYYVLKPKEDSLWP